MSQVTGLESSVVPRIATGFGGGMGKGGSVCGALVGAVMAVGLDHGRDTVDGDREAAYRSSLTILRQFQAEMGSPICRDITGFDLTTDEGFKAFYESDIPWGVCQHGISFAVHLAQGQLNS